MVVVVRGVYQDGQLRLFDPLELPEGQAVKISIETMTHEDALRAALGEMVIWPDTSDDSDAWVEDLADEIDQAFQGDPPLSEIIIQDRGEA